MEPPGSLRSGPENVPPTWEALPIEFAHAAVRVLMPTRTLTHVESSVKTNIVNTNVYSIWNARGDGAYVRSTFSL